MITVNLPTADETQALGARIGRLLGAGDVVGLSGPLGAGKTTLVAGIARGLRVDPGYRVTSPTFVFAHIYEGKETLYHIDLYRVEKEKQLTGIGLEEMVGGEGVAVIEWFERFPSLWPGDRLAVELSFGTDSSRVARITGHGPRGSCLEGQLGQRHGD